MNIKSFAKDTLIYGASDFVAKLVAFFTFPIIASALSAKEFGILELVYTMTMLAAMFANVGMSNAVSLYYWDTETQKKERARIISSGLFVLLATASATVLLAGVVIKINPFSVVDFFDPVSKIGLALAFLVMATTQWNQYCMNVTRLNFAPWKFFGISISTRVISILAGLVAILFLDLGIDGLLGGQALALAVVVPLAIYSVKDEIKLSQITGFWIKRLVKVGYPYIFASLAYWLFSSMDRWMLAAYSSVEETGIYSVAFRFSSVILFISMAFGQSWSPVAVKLKADYPEQYRELYGRVLIYLLFVMTFVGGFVSLFAPEIILWIMPEEYFHSTLSLIVLSFAVVIQSTQQVTMIGISLEKRTMLFSRIAWIAALINLILNYFLIPVWGALGASISTAISFLSLTTLYYYFTQKLHPIIVQKAPLLFLSAAILGFVFTSFLLLDNKIDLKTMLGKIVLLLVFALVGIRVLHLKNFINLIKLKLANLTK